MLRSVILVVIARITLKLCLEQIGVFLLVFCRKVLYSARQPLLGQDAGHCGFWYDNTGAKPVEDVTRQRMEYTGRKCCLPAQLSFRGHLSFPLRSLSESSGSDVERQSKGPVCVSPPDQAAQRI